MANEQQDPRKQQQQGNPQQGGQGKPGQQQQGGQGKPGEQHQGGQQKPGGRADRADKVASTAA